MLPGEVNQRKIADFLGGSQKLLGLSPQTRRQLLVSVLYGAGGAAAGYGLGALMELADAPHDGYDSKAHGARIGAAIGALLPELALIGGVRAPGY